jgi:hypothetical protein
LFEVPKPIMSSILDRFLVGFAAVCLPFFISWLLGFAKCNFLYEYALSFDGFFIVAHLPIYWTMTEDVLVLIDPLDTLYETKSVGINTL